MSALGGEDRRLRWLRRRVMRHGWHHIGDDAAVLPAGDEWAVTVDTQIEGVHFPAGLDPAVLARRLLAVNLSDLAAMGAAPAYGFLALTAPASFDHRRFFDALIGAFRNHDGELAGGDLSAADAVSAALTLVGRRAGRRWLHRANARPGDGLWLGGSVGQSALGLALLGLGARPGPRTVRLPAEFDQVARHLRQAAVRAVRRHLAPTPQLELGRWLGDLQRVAAIDVSDGLARDLHRMCAESGVGARIEVECLPLAAGFGQLAGHLGLDWQDLALGGGEDYVLLFTLPPGVGPPPPELGCRKIGRVHRGKAVRAVREGSVSPLPALGWDHLLRSRDQDSAG